jgi:hypothetical protein
MGKYRNAAIMLADDGMVDWEVIARRAIGYMSEAEVQDMLESEGFIEEDDADNDETQED